MKYLKTYNKLLESATLDPDIWEDIKYIILAEILDKYEISIDDVNEELGKHSGKYNIYDPIYKIKYDNLEMSSYVIDDIYELNRRIRELSSHFIIADNNVNSSKGNIEIKLSKTPDNRITIDHFNLEWCDTDNTINKKQGGMCDYETAVKILEWLNTFYTFCYPTEFEAFKLVYNTLLELYNVQIVFSLPTFEDERYRQVVCFQFLLSSKVEKVISNKFPVFIINTNYTESPTVKKREGNYNFKEVNCDNKERLLYFLKTEQF
jgi:hypothetical protein